MRKYLDRYYSAVFSVHPAHYGRVHRCIMMLQKLAYLAYLVFIIKFKGK